MPGGYAVCITVDNTRKIVHGLDRAATVAEVIEQLRSSCHKDKPQQLLESWKGCSRVMPSEEKLCISFEQWGSQARDVELIMTEAEERCKPRSKTGLGCCGKVARRKSTKLDAKLTRIRQYLHKRRHKQLTEQLKDEIENLKEKLACQDAIEKVLSTHLSDSTSQRDIDLSEYLPPELRVEFLEVKRSSSEQQQSRDELLQHRSELQHRMRVRLNEKMALERTVDELQQKVCLLVIILYRAEYIGVTDV